jgi:hypothetical protein
MGSECSDRGLSTPGVPYLLHLTGVSVCYKQPSTCIRDLWKLHVVGRSVSESRPSKEQLEGAVAILGMNSYMTGVSDSGEGMDRLFQRGVTESGRELPPPKWSGRQDWIRDRWSCAQITFRIRSMLLRGPSYLDWSSPLVKSRQKTSNKTRGEVNTGAIRSFIGYLR